MPILNNIGEIVSEFCIPTIIGIFTFATPLILQTISRIDDKYESTLLAKLFVKDWVCRTFIGIGIGSFVSLLLWMLNLPRVVDWGILNVWVDNSASLILLISVIALIVAACGILYLTYTYYIPKKLVARLQKQCNTHLNERIYFDGVSKVLNYSISKADEELARQTYSAIIDVLIKTRTNKSGQEIIYPDEFYDAVFEANERLLKRERKTLSYLNEGSMLSIFIDEVQQTIISDKTYQYMWLGLRQAVLYNNSEAIKAYWEKAHQYANFALDRIHPEYDKDFNIVNKEALDQQKTIKEKFVEFHYALGGLLLYHKMYDTLEYIMSWTNQQPPKYILVPSTMSEVINMYMQIAFKDGSRGFMYYESHYPFIGVRGVNASDIIRFWIKKYMVVLFLRQYTLNTYYIYEDTLQMPCVPESMSEKYAWNNELDVLKDLLQKLCEDKGTLNVLGFQHMSDKQWFVEKDKPTPSELIESFKAQIEYDMERTRKEQSISKTKLEEFYTATLSILCPVFTQYESFFGNSSITENYNKIHIIGSHQIMDKQVFVDDQEICHANADSIVAEHASFEFQQLALNIFMYMQSRRYILKEQDIWTAINNLSYDKNDFVIFSIGNNLNYLKLKESGLQNTNGEWSYNGIPIFDIHHSMNDLVSQSLWIIRKSDVPYLVFNKISNEDDISKYKLSEIDEQYHIFASIVDVYATPTIKKELEDRKILDAETKAVVCVDFNAEVRCKKTAKAIQLKIYSQFGNKEQANSVEDVDANWLQSV
ncbi:MAG: hypothetical protein IKY67_13130 [Paludibacteraceae bacterium]|nr:hypothetical protein [Paludibacteraceae bacterium]